MEPNDYGDVEADASPSEAQDVEEGEGMDETAKDVESKEDEGEQTALLPKSFFAGKDIKPGSTYTVKVEHVYEDEAECSLSDSKSSSKRKSSMDDADDSLDRMAK